jgi:hypothetical protein
MCRSVSVSVSVLLLVPVPGETERHGDWLGAVPVPSGPVVQCTHRLGTLSGESNMSSIWWADAMGQPDAVR